MSTRRSSPRVPHYPSKLLSLILRIVTRVHVPHLLDTSKTLAHDTKNFNLYSLRILRAAKPAHQISATTHPYPFFIRPLPHHTTRTMSTISLSDLEFITRESLASDFKSSGSALPPNTAVVDVRKPFLQQTCLRNHNTNNFSQSRYETAITLVATSKAQPGFLPRNSTTKLLSSSAHYKTRKSSYSTARYRSNGDLVPHYDT